MNLTQAQAVDLMQRLLFCAQKIRSNAIESLGSSPVAESVLETLMPSLFVKGDSNLVDILLRYSNKAEQDGRVEPVDLFNALYLCSKEMSFPLVWSLVGDGDELPDPMEAMQALMQGLHQHNST